MKVSVSSTHSFKVALEKEELAQSIRRSSTLLVGIEGFLDKFSTREEKLCAFCFCVVIVLASVDRFQAQE